MTQNTSLDTLAHTAGPPIGLVVSDSHLGPVLVSGLEPRGDVRLVTQDPAIAAQAPDDVDVTVGDVTTVDTLDCAAGVDAAVVGLRTDREALLVTQLLRTRFDIEKVVVVVNHPDRRDALLDVATDVVLAPDCLSTALQRRIEPTTVGSSDR